MSTDDTDARIADVQKEERQERDEQIRHEQAIDDRAAEVIADSPVEPPARA